MFLIKLSYNQLIDEKLRFILIINITKFQLRYCSIVSHLVEILNNFSYFFLSPMIH